MSKLDKKFEYLNLSDKVNFDYKDKQTNVKNNIIYMLNRSNAMFKYHNLPDTIPENELENLLQVNGYAVICKIKNNLYAVNAGLGGENDVYGNPTKAIVSVPYLNFNGEFDIDKDCVLIKNDNNAIGLIPMYAKYCSLMNESEISLLLALVNRRVQSFITAKDDNTKKSAEAFIEKVFKGELGIIADNALFNALTVQNNTLNNSNAITEIYNLMVGLKKDLFNEIGLAAYDTEKKERISNAELELNTDNLYPLVDDMRENRVKGIEKINNIFDTDIEVEFNSSWDYRAFNGASIHNTKEEIQDSEIEETLDSTNEESADSTNEEKIDSESEEKVDSESEENKDS